MLLLMRCMNKKFDDLSYFEKLYFALAGLVYILLPLSDDDEELD